VKKKKSHLNAAQEQENKKFGQVIKKAVDFVKQIRDMSFPKHVAEEMRSTHFEIWAYTPKSGHIVWDKWYSQWKHWRETWKDVKVKDDVETVAFTVAKALRVLADECSEVRDVITKGTEFPGFYVTLEYNALDRNDEYMWLPEQEMGMSKVILKG